jgi:two-component system, NtrC family, sensor kinase
MYFLPSLVISVFFILMGQFVLFQNPKSRTNISFSLLCFATFGWQFSWFLLFAFPNVFDIQTIIKLGYSFIIFIPITYYHFLVEFVHKQTSRSLKVAYLIGIFSFITLWATPYLIDGNYKFFWGHYPKAGLLHPIYLLFLALLTSAGLKLLLKKNRGITDQAHHNQVRYVLIALILYIPASLDFVVNYGVEVYPFGFAFIAMSLFTIAYAIVRHQLMNIEVIVRRTAVFAGLFAFTYAVFTSITIAGQEIFNKYFGWSQWVAAVPTVIIVTFALRPLENFLTNVTEKFLFQKKYDYRDLLRTFTNEVLTILELQKLTEQTVLEIGKIIKLEAASILLLDKDIKSYKIAATFGLKDKGLLFTEKDAIVSYLKQTHQPIFKDKSADQMDGHSHLRDNFKTLNAQLCLPISHHDELIGILALGMKKSGEEFTQEDIDILMTLARTLGIAIANAQLFDTLSKTQAEAAQREKMAVIGTLAAGINHEICNPLGIVRGQCEMFLLNLRDGLYGQKSKEDMIHIASDIMNKVIKETDRATAITKKLSGFAKPSKKVDVEEVAIEKEADEVLGLIGHDLRLNNIKFEKRFEPNFPNVVADKRQIQEILFNIIRNAAQAMDKKEGQITLSGVSRNGSAVIKIVDNGSGIPADKLNQIFNPFFTTKEPGKGTGLGLFIVRQVVERNKGTIEVESQEGVGTSFTLTFPIVTQPVKVMAA